MTDLAFEEAYRIGMGERRARFGSAVDRLIYLRSFPNVSHLKGVGLTFIAQRTTERFFRDGEVIVREDRPVDSVQFVVEGAVRVTQDGVHLADVTSPFAAGFMATLSRAPVHQRAVAVGDTVTLELGRRDLLVLFEDDFEFLETAMRQMTKQYLELQAVLDARRESHRTEPAKVPYPGEELDLVQRIQATRFGMLNESNLEPIVQFARRVEEVRVEPGHVFWEAGDPPSFGLNVVYGVVDCESDTRSFRMGPDSSIGYLDAYAQAPRTYRAVAATRVVALRGTADDFFDILEDHVDLAMMLLRFIAEGLLAVQNQVARLAPPADEEE